MAVGKPFSRLEGDAVGAPVEFGILGKEANLVANALRYGAPDSTVTIAGSVDAGGAAISVHNLGEQHLPHLFERFYRCDPGHGKGCDSGGLGLAIVRSIMQLHGGRVEVASGRDCTVFTLVFGPASVI